MPTIDLAMARSLKGTTWEILSEGIISALNRRDVSNSVGDLSNTVDTISNTASDVSNSVNDVKTALSSWDNCMSVSWCKWPVIGLIVFGSLMILSVVWCAVRCLCCGLSCCCECCYCLKCCGNCMGCCESPDNKRKHKYLDDPFIPPNHSQNAGYQMQPQMKTPNVAPTYNMTPAVSTPAALPASGPPQYAEFDMGKKSGNEDALPAMPTWDDAGTKKISLDNGQGGVEMDQLNKPSPSATPAPAATPAPTAAVGALGAGAAGLAARANNASGNTDTYRNAPPANQYDSQAAFARSNTPGFGSQAGRSTPGYGNQSGRGTPGFNNQQGGMNGYGAPGNDPYSQQNNSAYNTPVDTGYQNGQNNSYQTVSSHQPQQLGYDQSRDSNFNAYDSVYSTNNALPSPQESAFHYDNPSYQQSTQSHNASYNNAGYSQDQGYGHQNARAMGPYEQQQTDAYGAVNKHTTPVSTYGGHSDVFEMPAADYSSQGGSMAAQQNGAYSSQPSQPGKFVAYNPTGASTDIGGLQNAGGFDFNSGNSRPGTSSGPQNNQQIQPLMTGYDVQRQGTAPPQELYANHGQNSNRAMYTSPAPSRSSPAWPTH
ncbi:hypothetical protein Cpir12675_005453 [Ceratocystis pirilliformis]|uniref:Fibroin-3 related protein n=1 Tax=Ceratocystis pirilliformis TaxID=259994 RepID=A0ABR3YPU4_9PEZI